MSRTTEAGVPPAIVVTHSDQERLTALALAVRGRMPQIAEELLAELDRAEVVDDDAAACSRVVRMNASVTYRDDSGQTRTVTLVYPNEADIDHGRISILTPIGTALLGLSRGQSIRWTARDGRIHTLTVTAVQEG